MWETNKIKTSYKNKIEKWVEINSDYLESNEMKTSLKYTYLTGDEYDFYETKESEEERSRREKIEFREKRLSQILDK